MRRSRVAFQLNAKEIAEHPLYFWTFTFKKLLELKDARAAWNRFLTMLRKHVPSLVGLRVFELHKRRGMHVHVITTRYVRVEQIRDVISRMRADEWGRIHVVKADAGIGPYLAKYLSKKRPEAFKGWRLWAALDSKAYNHTRTADVILKSLFATVWAACKARFRWTGNGNFLQRKCMVMHLSKLCIVYDCIPGTFPDPEGFVRPWDLACEHFKRWYAHGFEAAIAKYSMPLSNVPF